MPWIFIYVVCFVASMMLGALLTRVARAAGMRLGLLDRPGGRKAHERPVAVTGGYAVFLGFLAIALAGGWIGPALADSLPDYWDPIPDYLRNIEGVRGELAAILVGALFIFLVGAFDDVKPLGPRVKLVAQILAVLPLIYGGVSIRLFLPIPALGWAVTIFWCVLLMNAFNFIDNMDGLCATVAGSIAIVLAIAAMQGGEVWLPAMFLCFAGILAGFLFFNFNPASVFLGDAGALSIGYLLAVFSILTTFYEADRPSGLPVLIPLAVMGVPLFDTISVLWIRWRSRKPLMVGDQNHFSHRLRAMGFSVRQTCVTIGVLTAAIGLVSLPLRYLELRDAILHLIAIAMLFGVVGALEFIGRQKSKPE